MNDLTIRRDVIPTLALSPELAAEIEPRWSPDGTGLVLAHDIAGPTEAVIAEARRALADIGDAPADFVTVRQWALPIAAAVRNPPHPSEIPARVQMIVLAAADLGLPAWAFNPGTQAKIAARFAFWPSAADIVGVLAEEVKPFLDKLARLRRVAGSRPANGAAPSPEPERPEPTEDQKALVRARVREATAALAAQQEARGIAPDGVPVELKPSPPRPAHLAPEVLKAMRDANPTVQAARNASAG